MNREKTVWIKLNGFKESVLHLQAGRFWDGQNRSVHADIFCSGLCRACAQPVFPFLQSPIIPTTRAGFWEVRVGDVYSEGARGGRRRRLLLRLLQRGHRSLCQTGYSERKCHADMWDCCGWCSLSHESFCLKQQTSMRALHSDHPATYWNVTWRTFLFRTNSDVCAILGPSRKTFIFIKSRAGQFGKPHSDISVLIIAATLRLQPSLFQRRSRLCATLGGTAVNIWFTCQIRFACEAARPHSPLSLRKLLI